MTTAPDPTATHESNTSEVTAHTPIIGVCAAFETATWGFWQQHAAIVPSTYLNKIAAAGAIAVGLAPDERAARNPELILDRIDGLMLIGGLDLTPGSYGAVRTRKTEATEPLRDTFELNLTRAAMHRDMPILGICRGMQILNVATGGTLHQHLRDEGFAEHRPRPGRLDGETFHQVAVRPESHAAALSGSGIQVVNSHHHQGVAVLGEGAVVTAHALPDRLPEAVEWPRHRYVLGVQWHPEAVELTHALTDFVAHTTPMHAGASLP
ncbi:gamma-glutamyl-gamma-aminobutyrate hydrolase family protein [Gordonia sp. HNM0687]|uniref:Gamma-glutamyl-gamma-aminobutyrate hydrolase family protein n=1 Tax=Gordonia mangrovi TaxID=2665643 RepID=A0A6L7GVB6_9ACTN|nr:gamma-glutamyl-gamma-aminobutyrate hydrolase family protein [Gordonia mangrovi]MXP23830.1 gamma-glutamyl-gamma-aminobutyrate hydrolase family protein [Gordonia mangrovi]UVF76388.1 gamma-glutamyl-gamma-aminobutyrate hydrolase family protein [Gordonia mangrovi]